MAAYKNLTPASTYPLSLSLSIFLVNDKFLSRRAGENTGEARADGRAARVSIKVTFYAAEPYGEFIKIANFCRPDLQRRAEDCGRARPDFYLKFLMEFLARDC